ncbi:MAG: HD domain-containing protein, partial [Planctomycetota bacterium]
INCLDRSKYCFVSVLGNVGGVITRSDIQKPPVRMWLFGMITILEMFISRLLKAKYQDSSWQTEVKSVR